MKRVSDKKAAWLKQYHAAVKARIETLKASNDGVLYCEKCLADTPNLEPHHPNGRAGENILYFKMLGNNFSRCRCHYQIHQHPRQAREEGWLE